MRAFRRFAVVALLLLAGLVVASNFALADDDGNITDPLPQEEMPGFIGF